VKIGLLGSLYFAGWTIACVIVPRLGDIYGRKWPTLISTVASFFCYLALILSRNLEFTTAMFFFLGATNPGKSTVGYVYLLELVPSKFQTYIGTLLLFGDGFTTIFICLYFRFMSKNWLYF
jgi:MFS family permease